jgi:hypothetical protein
MSEYSDFSTYKAAPTTDKATESPAPVAAHMCGDVCVRNLNHTEKLIILSSTFEICTWPIWTLMNLILKPNSPSEIDTFPLSSERVGDP